MGIIGNGIRFRKLTTLFISVIMLLCLSSEAYARTDKTASAWYVKKNTVTCAMPGATRSYHIYNQKKLGLYFRSYGCITTAVSICASGFGADVKPKSIRSGKASAAYSERYALSRMGVKPKVKNEPISLRCASQILTDMGIPNQRVTQFSNAQAEADIRAHLLEGKPVLVKVKKGRWKGIEFTVSHHALVLIGIVGDNVIFINPSSGGVNSSRAGNIHKHINITLRDLISHFMYQSFRHTESAYSKAVKRAGGYILVG